MVERKAMAKASPVLLVVISPGFCFATYNLLTMIMHHRAMKRRSGDENTGYLLIDPVVEMPRALKRLKRPQAHFHVALTATDAVYNKWQCRIMYYWYKRQKDLPGSEMGGFTRILRSGEPDNLMDEIPTMVVDPLPEGIDRGYVVLNRPWPFVHWLEKAKIKEEPDQNEKIVRKYYPEEKVPVMNIDPIGNSPIISKKMKEDPETESVWVLEMYAYAYSICFAWGTTYSSQGLYVTGGTRLWYDRGVRFDKRSHLSKPPTRNITLPPPGVPESVVTLVKTVESNLRLIIGATAGIPNWDKLRLIRQGTVLGKSLGFFSHDKMSFAWSSAGQVIDHVNPLEGN